MNQEVNEDINNRLRGPAGGLSATKHVPSLAAGRNFSIRRKGKCHHEVRGCRKCVVTNLITSTGVHYSYLLEHRNKFGKCIRCTVGSYNLPVPEGNNESIVSPTELADKMLAADGLMKLTKQSIPESGNPDDGDLPALETVVEQEQVVNDDDDDDEVADLITRRTLEPDDEDDPVPGVGDDPLASLRRPRKSHVFLPSWKKKSVPFGPEDRPKLRSAAPLEAAPQSPKTDQPERLSNDVPAEIQLQDLQKYHKVAEHEPSDDVSETTKSSVGSQLSEVKDRLCKSFPSKTVRKCSKAISQLVLLCIGLCHDTTLEAVLTRCIAFLDAMLDDGIVLSLHGFLETYIRQANIPSMFRGRTVQECYNLENTSNQPEGLSTEAMAVWDSLKTGIFTKHLSYVIGTSFAFFTCKIQNIEFNHPLQESVMKHMETEKIDGLDFIDHVLKLYNWVSTVGVACIEQKSLKPLTLNSGALSTCHQGYYKTRQWFIDAKRTGESTMEERQENFVKIETIYNTLIALCKIERDKFTTLHASSLVREVAILYNDIKDFVLKVDAVKVARGVHIHGPPKAGKSYISAAIHEQHCLARGVEYRTANCAQLNLLAKYQDEIDNSTQTITTNEASAVKEAYAQSLETAYLTALALVDPVPFHPNRSNIEDKAKITAQHISVVSTGNTEEPFLNVAKTPGAWTRRYTSVYMRSLPAFSDEHGQFDASKTDGSNNYHLFDVYDIVYDEDGRKTRHYFEVGTGPGKKDSRDMCTRDFMDLIRHIAIKHYATEDRLEKQRKSERTAGCTKCQRLAVFCTCSDDNPTPEIDKILSAECSVISNLPIDKRCPGAKGLGPHCKKCSYEPGNEYCSDCGRIQASPEAGVVTTVTSIGMSLLWDSVLPWINPFVDMKWLWSIDSAVWESMRSDLLEEISWLPDYVGTTTLSLIPESWCERRTASGFELTFLGKQKERFLRFVAAEKQILLPFRVLLKRAFTLAFIAFLFTALLYFGIDYFDVYPLGYEVPVQMCSTKREFRMIPVFPRWSADVFRRRDHFADLGIFIENYQTWNDFTINIYSWQRTLGTIGVPWFPPVKRCVKVLRWQKFRWWPAPLFIFCTCFLGCFLYMWLRRTLGFQARLDELKSKSMHDEAFSKQIYDNIRRSPTEYNSMVPTAVGVVGVIITGLSIWNMMRPRAEASIVRNSSTKSWNSFMNFGRKTPTSSANKGLSLDDTTAMVKRNTCLVTAEVNGQTSQVIGTFVESKILMLPYHFFKVDPYTWELQQRIMLDVKPDSGTEFKVMVYPDSIYKLDGKDWCLVYCPKGPLIRHKLWDLLPNSTGSDCHAARLVHFREDEAEDLNAKYLEDIDCAGFSCGRGLEYQSKFTQTGYCGTPLIRKGVIMGFHISGRRALTVKYGYAQEIMRNDVASLIEKVTSHCGAMAEPETGFEPEERLGYKMITVPDVPHPKTKVFEEIKHLNGIRVLGYNPQLTRYRTRAKKTMISDSLSLHTGKACRWKGVDMKEPWRHHNNALKHVADGAYEVPPKALEWAYNDYLSDIEDILPAYKEEHPELCRVLTDDEMVNGIDESLYMKIINMKTAIGPIGSGSGSKIESDLFVELDRGPRGEKRYALAPEALQHMNDMIQMFKDGKRYGIWARTCLKDEIVDEDSEKCRIFYILECVFGLAVRKYYLPIVEFISRNPLLCECAVGINCAGPEWEATMQYVQELATDDMMTDWDYSKYDLKRSQDVTIASLKIMRRIAQVMGYDEESLHIMDGIAAELRNPTMNWNGTIISAFLWPSGNSITVYGNSIENSLHNRISFYVNGVAKLGLTAFNELGKFRDNERIVTYGDDGNSGSKPSVRDICNFSAKLSYFSSIGMKITDAAKSDNPRDSVHKDEVDFLKRKSVYHPRLGCRVGALCLSSIDKMGHMTCSNEEPETIAVNAFISMLTESFLHGPEVYESYRTALQKTAAEHNLWTDFLSYDYETMAQRWDDHYLIRREEDEEADY